MDEFSTLAPPNESREPESPAVEAASAEYLGRWNRLVSTTNWEKGRIISLWRGALADSGAPQQAYSDEAWSRRVKNVSSQHVGRLRRVWDRFGETHEDYRGLYWSHFLAAIEWLDAEMWLEGAVQNRWSVGRMRSQRWEATGAVAEQKPDDGDLAATEFDEDSGLAEEAVAETADARLGEVQDVDRSGEAPADQAGDDLQAALDDGQPFDPGDATADAGADRPASNPVAPLANLPPLPDDLGEAFESFKLAILNHKLAGWEAISCEDVLTALEALKRLAVAPSQG